MLGRKIGARAQDPDLTTDRPDLMTTTRNIFVLKKIESRTSRCEVADDIDGATMSGLGNFKEASGDHVSGSLAPVVTRMSSNATYTTPCHRSKAVIEWRPGKLSRRSCRTADPPERSPSLCSTHDRIPSPPLPLPPSPPALSVQQRLQAPHHKASDYRRRSAGMSARSLP